VCLVPATNILIFKLIEFCDSQEISHTADAREHFPASISGTSRTWVAEDILKTACYLLESDTIYVPVVVHRRFGVAVGVAEAS
jgi:hypothetical protein